MGGDYGPSVIIPASLQVLRQHTDLKLIFVGQEEQLRTLLSTEGADLTDRFEIKHASEVVAMNEPPSQALRFKKDSSMRVAINLVKEGIAGACVSAGNTGALMATGRFVLKMLPGIDRPAIITRFPSEVGQEVRVLDLGANVECTAENLFQFAVMGSILTSAADNIEFPRVGLLNVGEEEIKGTEEVKQAAELLSKCKHINYIGFVEGDDIFTGVADVIVCDGFVGNVTLKACEGMLKLIIQNTKKAFMKNWLTRLSALPSIPVLKKLMKRMDPRLRNGATLLGLDGIVIKSHGGADKVAFASAIEEAIVEVEKNVPQRIREKIAIALSGEKE